MGAIPSFRVNLLVCDIIGRQQELIRGSILLSSLMVGSNTCFNSAIEAHHAKTIANLNRSHIKDNSIAFLMFRTLYTSHQKITVFSLLTRDTVVMFLKDIFS